MASIYTRQYPNTYSPTGSTVYEAIKNNDLEIRRILSLLDAKDSGGSEEGAGGGSSVNRNSIINAAVTSNGLLDCFTTPASSSSTEKNTVGIRAESPMILSFASGFAGKVPRDYIAVIDETNTRVWQNLPSSSTVYLYVEYNVSTKQLSFGYTQNQDTYSYNEPAVKKAGDCWYDMKSQNMKVFDGQVWQVTRRIFFAMAKVSSDGFVTVTPYTVVSRVRIAELTELIKTNPEVLNELYSRSVTASDLTALNKVTTKTLNATSDITTNTWLRANDISVKSSIAAPDINASKTITAPSVTATTSSTLAAATAKALTVTDTPLEAKAGATITGALTSNTSANLKGTTTLATATASSLTATNASITNKATVNALDVTKNLVVSGKIVCHNIPTNRIPYEDEVQDGDGTNICIWSDLR